MAHTTSDAFPLPAAAENQRKQNEGLAEVERALTMSRTGEDAAPFAESDLLSLERLAGLAALALRNSMLYEEAVRRRRQAEVLAEAERELVGELGRERLLRLIVQRAGSLFDAGAVVYLLRGAELVPAAQVTNEAI